MFHTSDGFWDYFKRFFALIEVINIAMHNLRKGSESILLETSVSSSMRKGYFKKQCYLISTEDSLLSLAATKTADGIFYCSVLKTPVDDRDLYIARYFEYAAFNGYFENVASNNLKQSLNIIPCCRYTSKDIDKVIKKVKAVFYLNLKGNLFRSTLAQNYKISKSINCYSEIITCFHTTSLSLFWMWVWWNLPK